MRNTIDLSNDEYLFLQHKYCNSCWILRIWNWEAPLKRQIFEEVELWTYMLCTWQELHKYAILKVQTLGRWSTFLAHPTCAKTQMLWQKTDLIHSNPIVMRQERHPITFTLIKHRYVNKTWFLCGSEATSTFREVIKQHKDGWKSTSIFNVWSSPKQSKSPPSEVSTK